MRFAKVTFGVGLGLFVIAAAGLTGTWVLAVGTVVMGHAALVSVVVLEERDHVAVEGLYPAASEPLEPARPAPASEDAFAQAA
jgi:hypothetical protein